MIKFQLKPIYKNTGKIPRISNLFSLFIALLFFSLCSLVTFSTMASEPANVTPNINKIALKRIHEIIELYNDGDWNKYWAYGQKQFGSRLLGMPESMHREYFFTQYDATRGITFHSIKSSSRDTTVAYVKDNLTDSWYTVDVTIETTTPHLLVDYNLDSSPPPVISVVKPLTDEQLVNKVKSYLQTQADADVFSGAVLIAKNGKPIFRQAYGLASKEFGVANNIDTKFNLGSMNKMFTGVAIAKLVEQGKLSFDDPLSKFLPDFLDPESVKKIKIKHLLTHTSGLGSYFNKTFFESARERFKTVDEMMTLTKDEKLAFEPGSKWKYSNTGMLVLGKVIEVAAGQSYFDYIREYVYKPARMVNSDSYQLDHITPNLALGYNKTFTDDGIEFTNNLFRHVIRGGPAGGGYSTVDDLLNFAVALRGNKLVGAKLVDELLSVKPELNSNRYGYGFLVDTETHIVGHSGGFDGISANLDMFLNNEFTVVVMANYGRVAGPVSDKIRELVLRGR